MALTGYFDESGTHAGSPVLVMAGFVGDERQWRKYKKRCAKLFARYRIGTYHTVDLRRSDNDFDGWSVDKKIEFIDELSHLNNDIIEFGVAATLKESDYYTYYEKRERSPKIIKNTRYGLLFRACMAMTIEGILTRLHLRERSEPELTMVLESGHNNAGDAVRIYNAVKRLALPQQQRALAGLTFKDKAGSLPLAAADLFAYSARWQEGVGGKPLGMPRGPLKSDKSYRNNMYRVELNPEALTDLYEQSLIERI